MRGLNEDEVCNFVALTQDKVSLSPGITLESLPVAGVLSLSCHRHSDLVSGFETRQLLLCCFLGTETLLHTM